MLVYYSYVLVRTWVSAFFYADVTQIKCIQLLSHLHEVPISTFIYLGDPFLVLSQLNVAVYFSFKRVLIIRSHNRPTVALKLCSFCIENSMSKSRAQQCITAFILDCSF